MSDSSRGAADRPEPARYVARAGLVRALTGIKAGARVGSKVIG